MAGRKSLVITERQFAVLRVLWDKGPLTVRGLMEHLPRGDRQPYTTVLGLLQAMEKAGLVEYEKQGLTHVYRSTLSRREATGNLLADFLGKFFHGSAEQLILGLVDAEKLDPRDLGAIEERLEEATRKRNLAEARVEPKPKPNANANAERGPRKRKRP